MDEWEEKRVVEALKGLFNIPTHWHFDVVKLQIANKILREITREGTLIVREKKSLDRREFTQIWADVYLRFSGNEYFIDTISYTADDNSLLTSLKREGVVFE